MLRGLQTAGWVAPGVPAPVVPAGQQPAGACFSGRLQPAKSFPITNSWGLAGIWGGPVASYLDPQVLQPLPRLCLAFFQLEKPAGISFSLTRLHVGCFLCQMPGSLIWGGPGLLCAAPYLHFPAPTAWAGDGDLAHVDGDKTWEGMGCFGSHLKHREVVGWWEGTSQPTEGFY